LDHVGKDDPNVNDMKEAKSDKILENEITCMLVEFKTNQVDGKGKTLRLRVPADFDNASEEAKSWARVISFAIRKAEEVETEDPAERSAWGRGGGGGARGARRRRGAEGW
jgi:hypothetical protein